METKTIWVDRDWTAMCLLDLSQLAKSCCPEADWHYYRPTMVADLKVTPAAPAAVIWTVVAAVLLAACCWHWHWLLWHLPIQLRSLSLQVDQKCRYCRQPLAELVAVSCPLAVVAVVASQKYSQYQLPCRHLYDLTKNTTTQIDVNLANLTVTKQFTQKHAIFWCTPQGEWVSRVWHPAWHIIGDFIRDESFQAIIGTGTQIRRVSRRHCTLYKLNLLTYLLTDKENQTHKTKQTWHKKTQKTRNPSH